ncbi:MAG: GNAT family N-acetyltransferase [Acidimicrobiales bacterium]
MAASVEIHPVTPDRWDDVARLAGDRGFYSGCWCMWWRLPGRDFSAQSATQHRGGLKRLVADGTVPGLLAYVGEQPVGWVAVAPREEYPRLNRSPKLEPVDETPVWAVTCFVIERRHRRQGVAEALLGAAVEYARSHGATAVEGVPIDTAGEKRTSADLYTGTLGMFQQAGFVEIARRGGRPIVRRT